MAERALLSAIAELAREAGFTSMQHAPEDDGDDEASRPRPEHLRHLDQTADDRALHDRGAIDASEDAVGSEHWAGDAAYIGLDPLAVLTAETERFLMNLARHVHAAHEQGNRRDVAVPDVFQAYTRYGE